MGQGVIFGHRKPMMLFFCLSLCAQVPDVVFERTLFPIPEFSRTEKGASVAWLFEKNREISHIELYFDQGIQGCAAIHLKKPFRSNILTGKHRSLRL